VASATFAAFASVGLHGAAIGLHGAAIGLHCSAIGLHYPAVRLHSASFVCTASSFNFHVCHYNIAKENIMNFCKRKIYYAEEEQKSLNAIRNLLTQTSWINKYMDKFE
jgi:hypothetical protein